MATRAKQMAARFQGSLPHREEEISRRRPLIGVLVAGKKTADLSSHGTPGSILIRTASPPFGFTKYSGQMAFLIDREES